jgi:hypothetical protein
MPSLSVASTPKPVHSARVTPIVLTVMSAFAGQDDDVLHVGAVEVVELLADGVCRALVPVGGALGLLGGEDLDKARREGVEAIRLGDVRVEGGRVELGEHEHFAQTRVDRVAQRDVDQPVLAGERHRGLGSTLGERVQPRALSTTQHHRDRPHAEPSCASLRS